MNVPNLTNNPNLAFSDLTDEQYREYIFPSGVVVRINNPIALNVNSKSGGHRVLDDAGVSHYIPAGWVHLQWLVEEGKPAFAF